MNIGCQHIQYLLRPSTEHRLLRKRAGAEGTIVRGVGVYHQGSDAAHREGAGAGEYIVMCLRIIPHSSELSSIVSLQRGKDL